MEENRKDVFFNLFKKLFDFIFSSSSFILQTYYQRIHFKQKKGTLHDFVNHYLYFLVIWIFLIAFYFLMVYLFGIKYDGTWIDRLYQLVSKPPLEIIGEIYKALKDSLLVHGFFIYVFYRGVSSNAERDFMRSHFLHHKISGLIKIVKMGGFTEESYFSEQQEDQIKSVRKNLNALVSPGENERIVFVAASGWDFFGDEPSKSIENNNTIIKGEKSILHLLRKFKKIKDENEDYKNGYMLDIISKRNRRVEIILLDPQSSAAIERAESYIKDNAFSHKAIKNVEEYKGGINKVLKNLAKAYKSNPHISVKLVKKIPQWKMIKVDKEIWVQPILSGTRSDHTILYGYRNESFSMYHAFFNEIEDLWNSAKEKKL